MRAGGFLPLPVDIVKDGSVFLWGIGAILIGLPYRRYERDRRWAVQELNPPKANYEFAASTARPTAHFTAKITQRVAVNLPIKVLNEIEFVVESPNEYRKLTSAIAENAIASPEKLLNLACCSPCHS